MNNTSQVSLSIIPKSVWVATGFIFVAIGIIGYVTPLMPGLVFFILASFCFAKGSRKFLKMLLANRYIGPQIMDWKRGKGMLMKTKITAIATVIVSMGYSAFFMVHEMWIKYCIGACALLVVSIILSVKTKK